MRRLAITETDGTGHRIDAGAWQLLFVPSLPPATNRGGQVSSPRTEYDTWVPLIERYTGLSLRARTAGITLVHKHPCGAVSSCIKSRALENSEPPAPVREQNPSRPSAKNYT